MTGQDRTRWEVGSLKGLKREVGDEIRSRQDETLSGLWMVPMLSCLCVCVVLCVLWASVVPFCCNHGRSSPAQDDKKSGERCRPNAMIPARLTPANYALCMHESSGPALQDDAT